MQSGKDVFVQLQTATCALDHVLEKGKEQEIRIAVRKDMMMYGAARMTTMPAPEQASDLSRMFGLFGVALGVVVTISLAAPPAAAIWFLRSRTVREVLH